MTRVNDVRQIIKQIICNNMIDYEKSKQVFDNLKRKDITITTSRNNPSLSSRQIDICKYDVRNKTLKNNLIIPKLIKARNISPIHNFETNKEIYRREHIF